MSATACRTSSGSIDQIVGTLAVTRAKAAFECCQMLRR
jgi:hypothetical protein